MFRMSNDVYSNAGSEMEREALRADDSQPMTDAHLVWWKRHYAMVSLIALTIFGGALRFYALDRPTLWGDETATYARICGTFRELLDVLRDAAFPPLHYLLYWWVSRHVPMDEFGLRLVPAIAGTLMIPAMYFLARQMVGVRPALVAATITACSAFLLAYSRDAKMYMDFWLAVTLATGCLLWFTRTGHSTAFLGWVAGGIAMVGLHGMGFAMLGVQIIMYLIGRRVSGWKTVAFVIGLLVICAGDAVHYGMFNVVAERMEQHGWGALGIEWADGRNNGQPASLVVADTVGAYLFSFLWIQERPYGVVVARVGMLMAWAMGITLAVLAIGAMPWPKRWTAYSTGHFSELKARDSVEPAWRITAWLVLWIVLPAYAVYCVSDVKPVSPLDWLNAVGSLADGRWWVLILSVIAGCALSQAVPYSSRMLGVLLTIAITYTLVEAFVRPIVGTELLPWQDRWATRLGQLWVLGPMLLVATAIWFDAAGETPSDRIKATLKILGVLTTVLLICWGIHIGVQAYFAERTSLLGKVGVGNATEQRKSIWMPRWLAIVWPAVAIGVAILFSNLPTRPIRWLAILAFVGVNLTQFGARIYADSEAPLAALATDAVKGRTRAPGVDETLRVYMQNNRTHPAPGWASLDSMSGAYYLAREMKREDTSPRDIRRNAPMNELQPRDFPGVDKIVEEVKADPRVTRLIVWTQHDPIVTLPEDEIADKLGEQWQGAGDRKFHVRAHWGWVENYQYRRREFVRSVQ